MVLKKIPFGSQTRRMIRQRQEGKCAICKLNTDILIFVRKDGNIFNNDISNCIALCPTCKKSAWT